MFSRRVIARCGPPAGVPYNASASFVVKLFGGVDYCTQCTVLVRTGTIEKGLEQRLVRYHPILYAHVYILGHILKPFGGRVGPPWAGP